MIGERVSRVESLFDFKRLVAVAIVLGAAVAHAAPPTMTPSVITCLSKDGNTLVSLSLKPEIGWSSVRVYFRKTGSPDFYYLELRSDGMGNYWGTLPRPDAGTRSADIQFAVKDGEGVETQSPLQTVSVTSTCTTSLSPEQERFAHNLVIGETVISQAGAMLAGWQCNGVVSRINVNGQLRPDATCRAVLIAAAAGATERILLPAALLGGAVLGGIIIHNNENPECSACRVTRP
ncbi:MAG: hypothetical protein ABR961_14930 [Thermoanaerobaculaceae bacterium]